MLYRVQQQQRTWNERKHKPHDAIMVVSNLFGTKVMISTEEK